MIELDSTRSLEIVLAGAITTSQLPFTATYIDHDPAAPSTTLSPADGQSNSTTAVTMVAAPVMGIQRTIKRVNVYNADTAQATVTIRVNNGGTMRVQLTVTIQTGERIEYEDGEGFRVFTVTGAVKVTAVQSTVEPGYIDGCGLVWVSGNSLTMSSGTAYVPSVGANVNVATAINKAGLVLSAATWYHVYLFLNSGVPDIEIVTTAPDTPYNGTARTKTGDMSRRYIGSVRSLGANAILKFVQTNQIVEYYENIIGTSLEVLTGGTATTPTNISFTSVVPATSQIALAQVFNSSTNATMTMANPDANFTLNAGVALSALGPSQVSLYNIPLSSGQLANYMMSPAPSGGGTTIRTTGYIYVR